MAISVNIPEEITDYHEKILFGLTTRQLGFGALAIGVAIAAGAICTRLLHLPIEIAGYVIMFCAVPPLALGFFQTDGMPCEQYAKLWWAHHMGQNVLIYNTDLTIDDPYFKDQAALEESPKERRSIKYVVQSIQAKRKRARAFAAGPAECHSSAINISTKKSCARSRAAARKTIKAALAEGRAKEQREKTAA